MVMIEQIARLSLAGVAILMAQKLQDQQLKLQPQPIKKQYRALARIERAVRKYGAL
jgi:hypothetical protein